MINRVMAFLRTPHLGALWRLSRDANAFYRLHYLHAAIESGLLDALRSPASVDEIAERLRSQRRELLEALLALGLALGELTVRDGRFRLTGKVSRAMIAGEGDPLAALVQEYVAYHGSAFLRLPAYLAGAPLDDYLSAMGNVVARSSREFEPVIRPFLRAALASGRPTRLLDVGCGSGIYLRRAAECRPDITGIGIDLQETVVEQARANLAAWGIGDRFAILRADVRYPPDELTGPFDLITLFNNIYYFSPPERPALLRSLRNHLAPGGTLAIVSMVRARQVAVAAFDLILQSTAGCAPLPDLGELTAQLAESGFSQVSTTNLVPGVPFYGLQATP